MKKKLYYDITEEHKGMMYYVNTNMCYVQSPTVGGNNSAINQRYKSWQ